MKLISQRSCAALILQALLGVRFSESRPIFGGPRSGSALPRGRVLLCAVFLGVLSTGHASPPPIHEPVPVLEKLIQQGGVFHGHTPDGPRRRVELRFTREGDVPGAMKYRLQLIEKNEDGSPRKSVEARLHTPREVRCQTSYHATDITICMVKIRTHPPGERDSDWNVQLDRDGRPRNVEAAYTDGWLLGPKWFRGILDPREGK